MERTTLWNGLGINVNDCRTSEEVMEKAGLDWTVSKKPLIWEGKTNRFYTVTRDDNNDLLGIVRGNYKPVQNVEMFSFVDELIPEGVSYEKVGISKDGSRIWLLSKMPETTILGDNFDPYIVFTTTHDGTASAKACITPVRVACQNTLNLAFKNASRKWSFRHSNNINIKIEEAKQTFLSTNNYMNCLKSDMAMHRKLRTGSDENSYTNRMLNIAEFGETTLDKAYAILSK